MAQINCVKGQTIRKVIGEGGAKLSSCMNFSRSHFPCMKIFKACMIFHFIFTCTYSPPPTHPDTFSNGLSLNVVRSA